MNVTIESMMTSELVTVGPETTVAQARKTLREECVSALPVLGEGGDLLGLVTSTDVLWAGVTMDDATVRGIMSAHVYTVPPYADVHVAARVMRNHNLHHVVVSNGAEVVGIVSSYDLLALVEQHRYVAKGKPATSRRKREKKEPAAGRTSSASGSTRSWGT